MLYFHFHAMKLLLNDHKYYIYILCAEIELGNVVKIFHAFIRKSQYFFLDFIDLVFIDRVLLHWLDLKK